MEAVCGHCGKATNEPLNRFGMHDYCIYETDDAEASS